MLNVFIRVVLKPFINVASDVVRKRLINKHTPKGVGLVVAFGVAFGYLDKKKLI